MNKWIKTIHTAKRQLNLSEEEYRSILASAGVKTAKDIKTWEQANIVMDALKKLGFKVKKASTRVDPQDVRHPAWISARQEYYIRGLWQLAARKKDEKSLRALCKRITGQEDVTFCFRKDAQKLILALRSITEDAGYTPD